MKTVFCALILLCSTVSSTPSADYVDDVDVFEGICPPELTFPTNLIGDGEGWFNALCYEV
jgi:hypothetical protein